MVVSLNYDAKQNTKYTYKCQHEWTLLINSTRANACAAQN